MSLSPNKELELHNLICDLLNKQTDETAVQRLNELLRNDSEAQLLYISYVETNESLRDITLEADLKVAKDWDSRSVDQSVARRSTLKDMIVEGCRKLDAVGGDIANLPYESLRTAETADATSNSETNSSSSPQPAPLSEVIDPLTAATSAQPTSGVFMNWINPGSNATSGGFLSLLLAIFSVGTLVVLLAIGYWDSPNANTLPSDVAATNPIDVNAQVNTEIRKGSKISADPATSVARLTNAWDTVWSGQGDKVQVNSLLHADQRLELTGGLAEVTFECGAVVIVQAPASFVIKAPNGGALESGKMTARVPGPSAKFWVMTSSMKILDLGTEFGISADASGASQVRVFEGAVEVEPILARVNANTRKLIKAGQVGIIEPSNGYRESKAGVDSNGTFVRDMPNSFEDNFANTIKNSEPWGYWSFNSAITSTLIPDMSGHGRFAQLLKDAMVVQGHSISAIGQAASLNEQSSDSILIPTGSTFSSQKDFSVELLFRTTTGGVLFSKTPLDGSWKPGSKLLFIRGGQVSFTAFDTKVGSRKTSIRAKDLVNDNRWHHVVLVNRANHSRSLDQTTLFVDGVKRASHEDWNITTDDDQKMPIRLGTGSQKYPTKDINTTTQFPTRSHFTGNIDEAAVYERCLSQDEVVAHYRAFLTVGINRRDEPARQSSQMNDDIEDSEEGEDSIN